MWKFYEVNGFSNLGSCGRIVGDGLMFDGESDRILFGCRFFCALRFNLMFFNENVINIKEEMSIFIESVYMNGWILNLFLF